MPEQKNSLIVQEISQDSGGLDFLHSDTGFLFDIGKIISFLHVSAGHL